MKMRKRPLGKMRLLFEMSTGASNKHLKNFNMMVDQSFEFYNAEWVE